MVTDIAESRRIPAGKLREYAGRMEVRGPEDAVRLGFADGTAYRDEMTGILSALCSPETVQA